MRPFFHPFYYADLAFRRGWRIAWYRSRKCPCSDTYSGGAKKDCPVCRGQGRIYSEPVQSKVTVGQVNQKRTWQTFGELQEGDITIAIPQHVLNAKVRPTRYEINPVYEIGPDDVVVLLDSKVRVDEMVDFAAGVKLQHRRPVDIEAASAIVDGVLHNLDISQITLNGQAVYWGTNVLPAGTQVSVQLFARPEYIVRGELPAEKRPNKVGLPRRLLLRLKDIL